jgi:hypothetical protein
VENPSHETNVGRANISQGLKSRRRPWAVVGGMKLPVERLDAMINATMTMSDRERECYRNGRDGRRRLSRQDTLLGCVLLGRFVGHLERKKKKE